MLEINSPDDRKLKRFGFFIYTTSSINKTICVTNTSTANAYHVSVSK